MCTLLGLLERNHVVPDLHIRYPLAHTLYNACSLMSQDDRERPFGVFTRERVRISMADAGVIYLYADFVGFWGCHLDILNGQILCRLPSDSRFACDGFAFGRRHCGAVARKWTCV